MKIFFIASAFALVGSCSSTKYSTKLQNLKDGIQLVDSVLVTKYAETITPTDLQQHLLFFADDGLHGRATGEIGQKVAAQYIKNYYENESIESPLGNKNYYQNIPKSFLPESSNDSENVLAFIKGTEKPDEVLIISAHYDHLGMTQDGIFNGADDNGSGTSALMEIAQAFKTAESEGHLPKRSILFLHVTAEEIGKLGSEYYIKHPVFLLKNTVANLNIDMIGRIDKSHSNNKDYLYLIGSDRLSNELHYLSEKVNNTFYKINLDYRYNSENDSNHYYNRSDHYNFAQNDIPIIFYFNGEHEDYHKSTDTFDKIDFDLLAKRTKLIFATAWEVANLDHRIKVDYGIIN